MSALEQVRRSGGQLWTLLVVYQVFAGLFGGLTLIGALLGGLGGVVFAVLNVLLAGALRGWGRGRRPWPWRRAMTPPA